MAKLLISLVDFSDVYRQLPGRRRSLSFFLTSFLSYYLSRLSFYINKLLISCPVLQKCDAMADFSIWFNFRFLKHSFVLVSNAHFITLFTFRIYQIFISRYQSDVKIFEYLLKFLIGPRMGHYCPMHCGVFRSIVLP